ncbi:MAG: hypothetical protein EBZ03_11145, partial [Betaproteobacteria bacterium]|nr:hypothetical protein [Betaproteobacteria bacterium]
KTAHQKQKTRHKDGCARMVARNYSRASSAFQASHLARKQVGTASAVLDDNKTITKCDRSCKTNLKMERQIA